MSDGLIQSVLYGNYTVSPADFLVPVCGNHKGRQSCSLGRDRVHSPLPGPKTKASQIQDHEETISENIYFILQIIIIIATTHYNQYYCYSYYCHYYYYYFYTIIINRTIITITTTIISIIPVTTNIVLLLVRLLSLLLLLILYCHRDY